MRVLVTGGLGVNGAWVVRQLLAEGHDVVATDVRPDWSLLTDIRDGVAYRELDVSDLEAVTHALASERPEVVAHLAAIVPADASPHRAFSINAQGSVNVLEAARQTGTRRVVFTSSRAVYGLLTGRNGAPEYVPVNEDHPREPLQSMRVYSTSKILAEEAGRQYRDTCGVEFCALRFATIYGPGKKARHGPIGVHTRMIENALLAQPTSVDRGGDERDDMIYVKDVAAGVVAACRAAELPEWAYNISTGHTVSLGDFAASVERAVPGARISVGGGPDYLGLGPIYGALDPTRAHRDLGFTAAHDLDSGVADFVESMAQLGLEPEEQTTESSWSTGGVVVGE